MNKMEDFAKKADIQTINTFGNPVFLQINFFNYQSSQHL